MATIPKILKLWQPIFRNRAESLNDVVAVTGGDMRPAEFIRAVLCWYLNQQAPEVFTPDYMSAWFPGIMPGRVRYYIEEWMPAWFRYCEDGVIMRNNRIHKQRCEQWRDIMTVADKLSLEHHIPAGTWEQFLEDEPPVYYPRKSEPQKIKRSDWKERNIGPDNARE